MRWIDHHCHLPEDPEAADVLVEEAHGAGVDTLVDVGTDLASSRRARDAAHRHPGVWATAGVHPHDAAGAVVDGGPALDELTELLDDDRVVAVGECGLDYHYDHSPRDVQRQVFDAQLGLAATHGLPVVIHARDAWEDLFAMLDEHRPARAVLHCFTGGPREAERALELGLWLSFSGIVTFPSAGELREAAARCPLDRVLVETDAPYLAPVPHRGRPNRPALVAVVGAALAAAMGVGVEELAAATRATTGAFYGLDGLDGLGGLDGVD